MGSLGLRSVLRFSSSSSGLQPDRLAAHWLSQNPWQCKFPCLCKALQRHYLRAADSCCHWEPKAFGATSALSQGGVFSSTFCRTSLRMQMLACSSLSSFTAVCLLRNSPPAPLHVAGAARGCDPLWGALSLPCWGFFGHPGSAGTPCCRACIAGHPAQDRRMQCACGSFLGRVSKAEQIWSKRVSQAYFKKSFYCYLAITYVLLRHSKVTI